VERILITGGSGFVGTHLIQFLRATTSEIFVLASGANASSREPKLKHYRLDVRNRDEVNSVVREVRPNQIYHLAGISAVDISWSNPRLTFEVNVLGAYNVFEAAMSLPSTPRILNVSTSQVYASSGGMLTEASPVNPDNPYAASKAMAEFLVVQYRKCIPGGIVTARSFNHTGPGQPTNFVLPSIAKQFAEIEAGLRPPRLTVGDIAVKRDFTDVRDVVQAYIALLQKGRAGEVYNVCSGRAVRLADLVGKFQAICGKTVEIEIDLARVRSNEVAEIVGDSSKIRNETGWSPRIPLEKTVRDLLDYWREKIKDTGSMEGKLVVGYAEPKTE
jgi:GDP-4-dehydro-6-deoxy-D-mannose reductase